MSKVLVHKGKPRDYKNYLGSMIILDKIAEAFAFLGHDVVRWRSACDDPFPKDDEFEYAVIWCGFQNWYPPVRRHLTQQGTKILYCDVDVFGDWMDEGDTDYAFILQWAHSTSRAGGVGGFVCWQEFPMESPMVGDGGKPLKLNEDATELLVILQEDISLRNNPCISPVFTDCLPWLYHLIHFSQMPLMVRGHPKYGVEGPIRQMVDSAPNARWSREPTLEGEMKNVRAVAAIDSHAGTKAIVAGLPVLCFGRAMYRKAGVSYPCDCDAWRTVATTAELKAGRCSLSYERRREYIDYVRGRTWHVSDLPDRLGSYLSDAAEMLLGGYGDSKKDGE